MNKYLFVSFVRSNTKGGNFMRKIINSPYSHVSITFDKKEFYAFSRLNYQSSLIAGFTKEYKSNYTLLKSKPAEITYYKIPINMEEYKKINDYLIFLENDKEYIFNYPSMFTSPIIHGFDLYKSYNCMTFVAKILSFVSKVKLSNKIYKYDLKLLEKDIKEYYDSKESYIVDVLKEKNSFYDKINFFKRKQLEFKTVYECFYRLLMKKASKKYTQITYSNYMKSNSKNTYNKRAEKYDYAHCGKNPRKNYGILVNLVPKKNNISILDVGCGTGEVLNLLYKKNNKYNLFGIDISDKMIDVAKKKNNKINFSVGDSENILFEDEMFDIVITSESFHHYPNPIKALNEFKRVLKKNGKIILCDMYRPFPVRNIMNLAYKFSKTGDIKIYSKKEIEKFFQDTKFDIIKKNYYYHCYIYELKNRDN